METIIRARNLTKIYQTKRARVRALASVNLDIEKGDFVAILGTSGSGKSTLLNMLAGLEPPSAGQILVMDKPVHRMSEDELVAFRLAHIGFIFQNYNLLSRLTVLQNTAFPLLARGEPKPKREQMAKQFLKKLGLFDHLAHYPEELSGGQQQRVAVARAIITSPKIIFADEPTGNLDSKTAEQIMELLQQFVQDKGTTVVMVTHDVSKAKLADKIIYMSDGEIERVETR